MHHHVFYNIDVSFIDKYLSSRVLTREKLCKIIDFDMVLLNRIIEGERPLRYFAFYKISNLLSIKPEDVIKDEDNLRKYNDYLRQYASEITLPQKIRDYLSKRSMVLSQEFEEMVTY